MNKPRAIIVDIDGVVCDSSERQRRCVDLGARDAGDIERYVKSLQEYGKNTVGDVLIEHGARLVRTLGWLGVAEGSEDVDIVLVFVTARNEASRESTLSWLVEQQLFALGVDELVMQPNHRPGPDGEYVLIHPEDYKREAAKELLARYDILFAIDDHPGVCRVYRELGIPTLQALWPGVDCLTPVGDAAK